VEQRPLQIVGAHQRPAVPISFGRQEFVIDAGGFGDRGIQHVFVHPVLGLRHAQVADHREAGVQAGLGLKPLVEIDRVFVDMGRGIGHVEQGSSPAACQVEPEVSSSRSTSIVSQPALAR
jgi:hypothetical protein